MSLFITVGSTGFDDLIKETTSSAFLESLASNGIHKIRYQYGSSESIFIHQLQAYHGPVLNIDGYSYKQSITEDIEQADMMISHAGSGTILQALRLNKKLIVVVNLTLMDNHQYELAHAMAAENYVICSDISQLKTTIQETNHCVLKPFPKANPKAFTSIDYPIIYLTTTTCSQPQSSDFNEQVPPLQVYVSTSSSNKLPGPHQGITVENGLNGLTQWQSDGTSSQLWIAVGAPPLQGSWTGNWTFEIGVSTHQPMHVVYTNNQPYLLLDDTDRNNALFLSSPFSGTAPNTSLLIASHLPTELSYSLCAIRLNTVPNYAVNTTITTRGYTNTTKQQFMVSNLVQDTTYTAYMAQTTQGLTGITMPVSVTTKMDANCRIIYDLPFCNQVAYSVPINPDTFNTDNQWDLAYQYDTQALEKFEPFSVALSQFNCETTQYSLVRNCTDCYRDYKAWLCSVTIPRCTDASSSGDLTQGTDDVVAAPALQDISVNASRNPWVDNTLNPGEWTELLPCIDLCYHVVQSCPPFMQFYCPTGDLATVQYGYWQQGTVHVNSTTSKPVSH
ncbi:stretch-activated Ca2+-permeable channel component-domain-containing protein [Gilbertella persicaria]|uniref:stretch-activated Ca2+-permeable channel component-domain-containing protein n=1 Tax=Gilbertella persicaria TaxID=101096 RepID=UPI00221F6D59|nr:stretch-activated Ca2+-permeable channel component-domain-containing protein [Gilbertella persicaria]KAI8070648.1 stretch-activated Ca2+-permeable channel component-domain-containing protein [Gilbertella persicaria]